MVNICVNSKDKYPELKEFLERIKIYAEDLKGMKREIIMPINNDDYLRDVVLENKLLGMLFNCTKGTSFYHLCVEYFSQFSFDSEMYT